MWNLAKRAAVDDLLHRMKSGSLGWNEGQSYAGQDLRHATLDLHFFKMCDFSGANLRGASLRGVGFFGCNLRGADLRDTDLTDAHFGRVLSHSPDHGLTDVTGAQWDGATLRRTVHEHVVGWPFDDAEAGG